MLPSKIRHEEMTSQEGREGGEGKKCNLSNGIPRPHNICPPDSLFVFFLLLFCSALREKGRRNDLDHETRSDVDCKQRNSTPMYIKKEAAFSISLCNIEFSLILISSLRQEREDLLILFKCIDFDLNSLPSLSSFCNPLTQQYEYSFICFQMHGKKRRECMFCYVMSRTRMPL